MSKSLKELPAAILTQHIAVLGKTGSGKTSTAKLAIEQVVAGGARVCVLDPIKSDWWGLTSSRNGLTAGRFEKAGFARVLEKLNRVQSTPKTPNERPGVARPLPAAQPGRTSVATRPAAQRGNGASPGEAMPPGEKAVLTAAAQWQDGVTRDQLGGLTGYKRSSRDAYVARLAQKGWIDTPNGRVVATEAGIQALGSDYEPLPTGAALMDWWRPRLPSGELTVLEVLVAAGGRPVTREAIDEATPFKRSSRDAYLARLASRKLVESVGRGEVQASRELFG